MVDQTKTVIPERLPINGTILLYFIAHFRYYIAQLSLTYTFFPAVFAIKRIFLASLLPSCVIHFSIHTMCLRFASLNVRTFLDQHLFCENNEKKSEIH